MMLPNNTKRAKIESVPFNWAEIEVEAPPADPGPSAAEAVARVMETIHTLVFSAGSGRVLPAKTIAARWCVLRQLLGLDADRSLRQCAKDIGVTPALLSKLGIRFATALKMKAPWQRSVATRRVYAERQRAVHAGTHVVSAEVEQRRLKAKMEGRTAAREMVEAVNDIARAHGLTKRTARPVAIQAI